MINSFDPTMFPSIQSAQERVEEISKRVIEFEQSFQANAKNTFSTVLKNMFDPIIHLAAKENNLDPQLVKAVIEQESGYNPKVISKAGAIGLMQLMPGTAQELGVKNPLNPEENIRGGTKYLASLLNRYQGNVVLALSAYNAGPESVDKFKGVPPYKETENYVKDIMSKLI